MVVNPFAPRNIAENSLLKLQHLSCVLVKQDFHRNFRVNFTMFYFLPFSPASLTEFCSFCYGLKDLFPLIDDLVALDRSKPMMSQAVEGTWAVAVVQRRTG